MSEWGEGGSRAVTEQLVGGSSRVTSLHSGGWLLAGVKLGRSGLRRVVAAAAAGNADLLRGADFSGLDLRGVSLRGVDLAGACAAAALKVWGWGLKGGGGGVCILWLPPPACMRGWCGCSADPAWDLQVRTSVGRTCVG